MIGCLIVDQKHAKNVKYVVTIIAKISFRII